MYGFPDAKGFFVNCLGQVATAESASQQLIQTSPQRSAHSESETAPAPRLRDLLMDRASLQTAHTGPDAESLQTAPTPHQPLQTVVPVYDINKG